MRVFCAVGERAAYDFRWSDELHHRPILHGEHTKARVCDFPVMVVDDALFARSRVRASLASTWRSSIRLVRSEPTNAGTRLTPALFLGGPRGLTAPEPGNRPDCPGAVTSRVHALADHADPFATALGKTGAPRAPKAGRASTRPIVWTPRRAKAEQLRARCGCPCDWKQRRRLNRNGSFAAQRSHSEPRVACEHRCLPTASDREASSRESLEREARCPGTELNRRHEDFQSSALPTELPGHRRVPSREG